MEPSIRNISPIKTTPPPYSPETPIHSPIGVSQAEYVRIRVPEKKEMPQLDAYNYDISVCNGVISSFLDIKDSKEEEKEYVNSIYKKLNTCELIENILFLRNSVIY